MPDNYGINEAVTGTITQMAANLIAGIKYPRIKIGWGADGAYADASAANPIPVAVYPAVDGGLSPWNNLDLGNTGQVLKASAGELYSLVVSNQHATLFRYLKLYDKATAATSGDTPVMTIAVPPLKVESVNFPTGLKFTAGISVRATTGVANADVTSPSANDMVVNAGYK